jgi:hypothetical protein
MWLIEPSIVHAVDLGKEVAWLGSMTSIEPEPVEGTDSIAVAFDFVTVEAELSSIADQVGIYNGMRIPKDRLVRTSSTFWVLIDERYPLSPNWRRHAETGLVLWYGRLVALDGRIGVRIMQPGLPVRAVDGIGEIQIVDRDEL